MSCIDIKIEPPEFDGEKRNIKYIVFSGVGEGWEEKKGVLKDLLFGIPYLLWPPADSIIPPIFILNEILLKGISDAGMGVGCRWYPLEISEKEFSSLIKELETDKQRKCRYIHPPEWVNTYSDWHICQDIWVEIKIRTEYNKF